MLAHNRELIEEVCSSVSAARLADRTMALVQVPSPSGHEADLARVYAEQLADSGLQVLWDREIAESPSLVARTSDEGGLTLQLDGHLDHVSSPHAPPYRTDKAISGRGSCDMKGGLAVIAEVAQLLLEHGVVPSTGSLLVTAHGQHEEAVGDRPLHAPLVGLLRRDIKGDACLIPEGPHTDIPIAGRGLVIFELTFWRDGDTVHELLGGVHVNPLTAAWKFANSIDRRSREWNVSHPLAGSESVFVGSICGGDYYNRIPTRATVRGTRRYPPGQTVNAVCDELATLAHGAAADVGCQVSVGLQRSGQPFLLDESEPIVRAVQESHLFNVGIPLPASGMAFAGDVSQVVNVGRIPAVYHGTDSSTAHSDTESVAIADLARCAKVLLGAAILYLNAES